MLINILALLLVGLLIYGIVKDKKRWTYYKK